MFLIKGTREKHHKGPLTELRESAGAQPEPWATEGRVKTATLRPDPWGGGGGGGAGKTVERLNEQINTQRSEGH